MKKYIQISAWVTVAFGVAVAFNQCGGVKFVEGSNRSDGYSLSANGNNMYQTTVPLTGNGIKPLDIVWVIDNSGSMNEEAANVRSNFAAFAENLKLADVKLALISRVGTTGTFVTMPSADYPTLQIDRAVGSTNPLHILTAALCPAAPEAGSACALIAPRLGLYTEIRGKLNGFLRKDSRKIFVFVTDDNNAASVSSAQFKGVFDSLYAPDSLVAYGWVGLGKTLSPSQTNTGTSYLELAEMTGGKMNNVGDSDWSGKFVELQNNVTTLAFDTIPLPQDVVNGTILSVVMNDREISGADYQITSTGIVLSPSVRAGVPVAVVRVEFKTAQ